MTTSLDALEAKLAGRSPTLSEPPDEIGSHAAVALLLAESPNGVELLFIERARRPGDHWSGDMAFPGGRRQAEDVDIAATAAREVREEIGVELPPPMARLDDYDARTGRRPWPLLVSLFAYRLPDMPAMRLNHEVESVVWTSLDRLTDPQAATRHRFPRAGTHVVMPAVALDERVVWGMTYTMLSGFLDAIERPFPNR